ncbi:MAG: NAD(P)(+) transhydrogenase (Re/Si-specific) subunit beta [Bacteroidetes bacterium]|nr:NAD(P)(+) transhydrogenase (Re/Si-specific) subunit beta [Bacteroidota bacterium]MBU1422550.1 NAD(P)(+) transhydrogenase (Re/Si-specific) subunit beta [Bacteroidota bacterium]MBU2471413.1 NAD(P)(+) transhydrogenase (Re/Si-specific) subunit beta [Bacteroidota bacterium]
MNPIIAFAYLIAAACFIIGLKLLSSPRTARNGNLIGALGMLIAVVVTLQDQKIIDFTYILAGLVIGSAAGAIMAKTVQMTAMPQMVGLLNGFGGGASTLVAYAEYIRITGSGDLAGGLWWMIGISLLIGTITFTGSSIAFAKLQGIMTGAPILYRFQKHLNALMLLSILVLITILVLNPTAWYVPLLIILIAAILGVTSVIPIGGADMPVVISLLNSYSGMAAAATGFVLSNNVLIISGTLVGASGIILTNIMCKAMNRSLGNVLFAGIGTDGQAAGATTVEERTVVRYTPEDAMMIMENASSVIIVPGYGLAVAQAQHVLEEVSRNLREKGVTVRYAIHPVAGRMPGHMNVLLAEANVPYDFLLEMDQINEDFPNTDVALVIGANDVVNPAARYKKNSPLYGMPILNVDYAKTVIVCKRSLNPGFAGEDNELFYMKNTMMVFGDAKKTLTNLLQLVKAPS